MGILVGVRLLLFFLPCMSTRGVCPTHGHYSKYRWEILSSPRTVRLLTLTSCPMSWATMVSEPGSPLLEVESVVIFFILAADADAWACHNFFE
jgi:hypothetical protein